MKARLVGILTHILLFLSLYSQAQMVSVSGYVKNQLTGEAIRDVSVFESISGVGTITNKDGFYRLLLNPEQQKLEISSPDFNLYESTFKLVTDTIIVVELTPCNLSDSESNPGNGFRIELFTSTSIDKADTQTK